MKYLSIVKWDEFQQYKDRDPKWIKLYRDLLDSYDFVHLPEPQQINLVKLWLLAAKLDNKIPNDPEWISRRIEAKTEIDLNLLESMEYIEINESVQDCTDSYTETETYTEEGEGYTTPEGEESSSSDGDFDLATVMEEGFDTLLADEGQMGYLRDLAKQKNVDLEDLYPVVKARIVSNSDHYTAMFKNKRPDVAVSKILYSFLSRIEKQEENGSKPFSKIVAEMKAEGEL